MLPSIEAVCSPSSFSTRAVEDKETETLRLLGGGEDESVDVRLALEAGGGAKNDDSLGWEAGVGFADLLFFAELVDVAVVGRLSLSTTALSTGDALGAVGRDEPAFVPFIVLNAARATPNGVVMGSGSAGSGVCGAVDVFVASSASIAWTDTSSVGVGMGVGEGDTFCGPVKKLFNEVCLPENSS